MIGELGSASLSFIAVGSLPNGFTWLFYICPAATCGSSTKCYAERKLTGETRCVQPVLEMQTGRQFYAAEGLILDLKLPANANPNTGHL